jgi:hypothetical protein
VLWPNGFTGSVRLPSRCRIRQLSHPRGDVAPSGAGRRQRRLGAANDMKPGVSNGHYYGGRGLARHQRDRRCPTNPTGRYLYGWVTVPYLSQSPGSCMTQMSAPTAGGHLVAEPSAARGLCPSAEKPAVVPSSHGFVPPAKASVLAPSCRCPCRLSRLLVGGPDCRDRGELRSHGRPSGSAPWRPGGWVAAITHSDCVRRSLCRASVPEYRGSFFISDRSCSSGRSRRGLARSTVRCRPWPPLPAPGSSYANR